ncbi:alpha-amylase 1 [Dipodascopsis uninucleata]
MRWINVLLAVALLLQGFKTSMAVQFALLSRLQSLRFNPEYCEARRLKALPYSVYKENHVQLASYQYCNGVLNATIFVFNDGYTKKVDIFCKTTSGFEIMAEAHYAQAFSDGWEVWEVSNAEVGSIKEIEYVKYVFENAVTYLENDYITIPSTLTRTEIEKETSCSIVPTSTSAISLIVTSIASATSTDTISNARPKPTGEQRSPSARPGLAREWRTRTIYQILTDRFARSDGSLTAECITQSKEYCGGTYKGVMDKLDYIQGMGFDAIWISPIVANIEGETPEGYGYHGYWMQNMYDLNPHFGEVDDLKALIDELHRRDMYIMVDVVVNHYGWSGNYTTIDYSKFVPFNNEKYFHPFCFITNYSNQAEVEECWLGDDDVPLVDVDTSLKEVQDEFIFWIEELRSNYSIDGFRIDTLKHVQIDFWDPFQVAMRVYGLGEVFHGDPEYVCQYQGHVDGLLNYPMYYQLLYAFQYPGAKMDVLVSMIEDMQKYCDDVSLMGNFIENHDNPRFGAYTNDPALKRSVIAFTILFDGIPIIYYGQEQDLDGGGDPENREALWLTGYSTDTELYKFIKLCNYVRAASIRNDPHYVIYQTKVIYSDVHTIALRKGSNTTQVITILSNQGVQASARLLVLSNTDFDIGNIVIEVITCTKQTITYKDQLIVHMSGEPRIYINYKSLLGSGVCGL